jgi:molybdopterin synthase sulfur carrier subunit
MKVSAKYFGQIAELIGKEKETLEIENQSPRAFFNSKYPQIEQQSYKIAINQEIMEEISSTDDEVEIALLPPFAGG